MLNPDSQRAHIQRSGIFGIINYSRQGFIAKVKRIQTTLKPDISNININFELFTNFRTISTKNSMFLQA